MDYFTAISHRCNQLTEISQAYLDKLPFIPNDEVMERIWNAAQKYEAELDADIDWDSVPEWAARTLDGWMPYSQEPRNGSIYFALGYSVVAQEANLRRLLEYVEGGTDTFEPTTCLAEEEIVKELCQLDLHL